MSAISESCIKGRDDEANESYDEETEESMAPDEAHYLQQQQAATLSADSDTDEPTISSSAAAAAAAAAAANRVNNEDDEWQDDECPTPPPSVPEGNMRVVASHYNELKESGRVERLKSRIVYMRNFNNWIKSQLIAEYLARIKQQQRMGDPMRVMDLCCGKGGDLLKWEKANITHLICTDIAEVSVEQCKRRYEQMLSRADKSKFAPKFSAEFFACDATLVRLRERYKDPSLKLNLVSCQFAFHYSFESLSQADCMTRNAAECLQPGGYFIATIPDANEIMRRLHNSSNARSFGNEVYNIEFACDTDPPPLFGAKYQFNLEGVVDCPEFLVHFPTLIKLCRKYGLKLERKTTFADYYKESLEKGRSLLQRMSGLETIYSNRYANNEQYAHLRNLAKGSSSKCFGTLSKAEWEAATLYLVCAFKKCKNSWDAQGKPVFEFD